MTTTQIIHFAPGKHTPDGCVGTLQNATRQIDLGSVYAGPSLGYAAPYIVWSSSAPWHATGADTIEGLVAAVDAIAQDLYRRDPQTWWTLTGRAYAGDEAVDHLGVPMIPAPEPRR